MSGNIFLTRPGKCKNFVAVVDVHEPAEVFGVVKYDLNLQYLVFKYICIVSLCLSKNSLYQLTTNDFLFDREMEFCLR